MGNYSGSTIHTVIFDCYKYGIINKNWVKLHAHLLAVFFTWDYLFGDKEIKKTSEHSYSRVLFQFDKEKHITLRAYISNRNSV